MTTTTTKPNTTAPKPQLHRVGGIRSSVTFNFDTIQDDRDLAHFEKIIDAEVSSKFFVEPNQFRSLDTIIEVLESQLCIGGSNNAADAVRKDGNFRKAVLSSIGKNRDLSGEGQSSYNEMWNYKDGNDVYSDLERQRSVVEDAIEFMVVNHVEEMNKDVGKVAEVSRDFQESVGRVRALRKRVQWVQGRLGHNTTNSNANGNSNVVEHVATSQHPETSGAAKSLRDLWLKKLECEAVLSLLRKIEIIREAPIRFDQLVPPVARHCRIGAATVLLADATDTLFLTSGVEALAKVSSQFMMRKEKALKILWKTMNEVLHLQNGGPIIRFVKDEPEFNTSGVSRHSRSSIQISCESGNDYNNEFANETELIRNCFDDNSNEFTTKKYASIDKNSRLFKGSRMISTSLLDSEFKLETDELRCMDMSSTSDERMQSVARYTDSVMALRILVDSLKLLKSLDDVERTLSEHLRQEIRKVSERIQDNTFSWIDQRRADNKRLGKVESKNRDNTNFLSGLPREIQRHFFMMLLSYENVLLRYCHLAQIIRQKKV